MAEPRCESCGQTWGEHQHFREQCAENLKLKTHAEALAEAAKACQQMLREVAVRYVKYAGINGCEEQKTYRDVNSCLARLSALPLSETSDG